MEYKVVKLNELSEAVTERFLVTMEKFGVDVVEGESDEKVRVFNITSPCGTVWRHGLAYAILSIVNEAIADDDSVVIVYDDVFSPDVFGFKLLRKNKQEVPVSLWKITSEVMGDLSKYRPSKVVKMGFEMSAYDDEEINRFILNKISMAKADDMKSVKKMCAKYSGKGM